MYAFSMVIITNSAPNNILADDSINSLSTSPLPISMPVVPSHPDHGQMICFVQCDTKLANET